jgi:hypothetical protein
MVLTSSNKSTLGLRIKARAMAMRSENDIVGMAIYHQWAEHTLLTTGQLRAFAANFSVKTAKNMKSVMHPPSTIRTLTRVMN